MHQEPDTAMGSIYAFDNSQDRRPSRLTPASSIHIPLMDGVAEQQPGHQQAITDDPSFDIIEWHPAYQSCQRYFLDHAQYEGGTQAVCSLINIRLPFQWLMTPITTSAITSPAPSTVGPTFSFGAFPRSGSSMNSPVQTRAFSREPAPHVSLIPYIRRLVVTGFDKPAILHGFFGDEYVKGILPHLDCERRNYLFAAKAGGWRSCKQLYDAGSGGGGDETVPFLKPLDEAKIEELTAAEKAWSQWLAMEDWMVGPLAPNDRARPE